jgi:DNA-binding GntR family transcriptional regulator
MPATLTERSTLVKRESLTDQTARGIREAILDGTYALGQTLRENVLASRFGVSGSVIREALHILQGEGIIVTKPYCGRSVFSMTPQEFRELRHIRASLEGYAAHLAATKISADSAEPIRAAAARFTAGPPSSYSDWVDRELGFHRAVWDAARNEWLVRQLNQCVVPVFALSILKFRTNDPDVQSLWRDSIQHESDEDVQGHQRLARLIVNGDGAAAQEVMLSHIIPEEG